MEKANIFLKGLMKMRIGVDIDGVVSDSYPFWLPELNRHFGKNIATIDNYNIHTVYDVPGEEMNEFFVNNAEYLFSNTKPVPGAREGIETLQREGHEIIYITARTTEERDVTLRWFKKNEIPYREDHVLFTGLRSKLDLVKVWGIEAFVEDYLVNASMIAAAGVPVFLLDADYNRSDLPAGVTRCYNWPEIVEGIRSLNP